VFEISIIIQRRKYFVRKSKSIYINLMLFTLLLAGTFTVSAQTDKVIELNGDSVKSDSKESNFGSARRGITITRSGNYRLVSDLTVRGGDGITISASNVTLDLGGNTISTSAGGTGRGVAIEGAKSVKLTNGSVGGFNQNVSVEGSENVILRDLQIAGRGLAPNNGPSEIGILLVQTRATYVSNNTISSVNLGVFVRGGLSTGNRIFENVIVGGANPASNLLGICYNPAAGAGTAGPRGDNIYNNHITRFNFAVSVSADSVANVFNDNVGASFTGLIRDESVFTTNGGTNVSDGNLSVLVPAEVLPN
jgi:hypothetical protein